MNSTAITLSPAPSGRIMGWLRSLHELRLPPIETYPRAIAFARTWPAKGLLALLVAAAVLAGGKPPELAVAIGLAAGACAIAGAHRITVLSVATLATLVLAPDWYGGKALDVMQKRTDVPISPYAIQLMTLLWVLLLSTGLLAAKPWLVRTAIFRRPVLSLLLFYGMLLVTAAAIVPSGMPQVLAWAFLATFGAYMWFLAYALTDAARGSDAIVTPLGAFHAPWNWSSVPFGKGLTYLRKFEAKTPDELAVTQLKGVKLLAWAVILKVLLMAHQKVVHGILEIPTFEQAFDAQVAGTPFPVLMCWASVLLGFIEALLLIASWGHAIIAIARISGFRLPRNTHRPLSSRTIAEFWNRYYFYFKELLADLFFYPTYLRFFRSYPRLRVAFATFMAAGVGNALFHFIRDIGEMVEHGLATALVGYQTYLFYCLVLAGGITVSQLRVRNSKTSTGFLRARLLPSMGVALFFSLLSIFDDMRRDTTLADHLYFLARLFGADIIWS